MGVILGIGISLLAIIALFQYLNWKTTKTYRPTPEAILATLDAVLCGSVTYLQWDEFICVPIRHDPLLELVRLECVSLETKELLSTAPKEPRRKEWPENVGFGQVGLDRVRELRAVVAEHARVLESLSNSSPNKSLERTREG